MSYYRGWKRAAQLKAVGRQSEKLLITKMNESQIQIDPDTTELNESPHQRKTYCCLIFPWVVGIIIIMISMCRTDPYDYDPRLDIGDYDENLSKWESQHITHYRMFIKPPIFGCYWELPMPLTVEVQDGNIISVVDADGVMISPPVDDYSYYCYENYFTVSGLFTYIHNTYIEEPPALVVSYDPDLGFPSEIYINPYAEPCCDDFYIYILDVEVLP